MVIPRNRALLWPGIAFVLLTLSSHVFAQQDIGLPSAESSSTKTEVEAKSLAQLLDRAMTRPGFHTRNPRYTLRAGDVLEITFQRVPTFNQTQAVQPDGYIQLQNVGDLYVAEKTIPELAQALQQTYTKIMRDPIITVILKDFEHPYFIASGEVVKPGKYELRGVTTAAQAIAIAGGLNPVAKSSHVLLFRRVSDDYVSIKQLDLKKMLDHGNLREDTQLQPGDLLFVPKSVTASIFRALVPHTSTGLYLPFKTD